MCIYISLKPSFEKLLTLDDFRSRTSEIPNITMKDKKDVRIAILDDMGFDRERLNKMGYKDIKLFDKFDEISDFENFDIIMCDINGIGEDYHPNFQGAAIAKMIKSSYPNKIVVVYSASKHDPEINNYIKEAYIDDFINKNISKADLNDRLNGYILKLNDPITVWEKTRMSLYQHNVSPKIIGLMEHYYVKSFLSKKDYTSKITKINGGIPQDILNVLSFALNIISFYLTMRNGG